MHSFRAIPRECTVASGLRQAADSSEWLARGPEVPEAVGVSTSSPPAAAAAQISYGDLYARWERGNWSATGIDFTVDREHWHERFSDLQRKAALWNYTLFFHGEDEVTDDLSAMIAAAPREEQKYFLATQQVDEARHSIFFKRFMEEVPGLGDGTIAGTLAATGGDLTWGWKQTFGILKRVTNELHGNHSSTALARAVTMYHLIVEATLAQPGQHFIEDYLVRENVLPGFQEGMKNVAADEQRHIAFGVKLLHDLALEDPEVRDAVADLLREVLPISVSLFVPPNWDRGYTECFGFTLEEIYEEGARSLDSKLRAAGLPLEDLPGPIPMRVDMSFAERGAHGLSLVQHGILGDGSTRATPNAETMALLFDVIAHGVDHRRAPGRPVVLQWDFTDAEPWHLRVDNGSTRAERGMAPDADLVLRVAFNDWVDVVGRRTDPRRLLLTRRLRPKGSLRVLAMMPRLFA